MSPHNLEFQRGAVSPWTCLSEGWRLIGGDYLLFLGMALIVFVASEATMGLLLGPAMCGFHLCLLRRERDLPIRFEMFFDGFHYFAQSLIATLIIMAPMTVLGLLLGLAIDAMMIGGLFLLLPPRP